MTQHMQLPSYTQTISGILVPHDVLADTMKLALFNWLRRHVRLSAATLLDVAV
jgi:hypothetical protein